MKLFRSRLIALLTTAFISFTAAKAQAAVHHYIVTTDWPATYDLFVDDSVPDLDSDPTTGQYTQPAALTPPPGNPAGHDPFYHYIVTNDPAGDKIRISQGYKMTILPGGMIPPGEYLQTLFFEFTYPNTQFSSDAFQHIVFPGSQSATVTGIYFDILGPHQITSVTLVPVPEPASLGLIGIAIVGTTFHRRRQSALRHTPDLFRSPRKI